MNSDLSEYLNDFHADILQAEANLQYFAHVVSTSGHYEHELRSRFFCLFDYAWFTIMWPIFFFRVLCVMAQLPIKINLKWFLLFFSASKLMTSHHGYRCCKRNRWSKTSLRYCKRSKNWEKFCEFSTMTSKRCSIILLAVHRMKIVLLWQPCHRRFRHWCRWIRSQMPSHCRQRQQLIRFHRCRHQFHTALKVFIHLHRMCATIDAVYSEPVK